MQWNSRGRTDRGGDQGMTAFYNSTSPYHRLSEKMRNSTQYLVYTWCAPTDAEDILVATAVATAQHAIRDVVLQR